MKKSLITGISALMLSVLTLGACGPATDASTNPSVPSEDGNVPDTEVQEIYTIDQLLSGEISDETGYWEPTYMGRHVRIEKAGVVLAYEHEMYIQQTTGETVGDLHSIQVVNNNVDFTEYFYNNSVNVEGTVGIFEDRIVIEDATVELVSDGMADDESNVFFWPNFDRGAMDNGTKFLSGTMVSSILQIATKPETIVAGQPMTFKVAFPGEDLDYTNELNTFVMNYTVPGTLNDEEIAAANELFGSLEVGDGLSVLAAIHFVDGYFNYLYMPGVSTNEIYNYKTDLENVFSDETKLLNEFIKFHTTTWEEWPLLTAKDPKTEKPLIYSFVGQDDRYTQANRNIYTITAYTYEVDQTYDILKDAFEAAGWKVQVDLTEEEGVIEFVSATKHNTVDMMKSEGNITIASITDTPYTHPDTQEFATFAELTEGLKHNVQRYAKAKDFLLPQGARNYQTSIVDVASILNEGETVTSYFLSKQKESINVVNNIEGAHELVRFNLSVTDSARLDAIKDAYIAALEEAGFVKITVPAGTKKAPKGEGYFNVKSGEFISTKTLKVAVVEAVAEAEGQPAVAEHGVLEFYVDAVSIDVNRALRKLLPEDKQPQK